ncbi:unnamed protein product [Ceutorhynchus assimilis]|uniref:tRNA-splicing endonuclease subunit Sen15 domain-containing protein n=1 Tax=Ceutorhynchus assimilis TaxID=467358 RepID=A0A9P0GKK7_9CUCU|nr:unnamed protein product [Ceutorhynchus assimilis]
MDTSIKEEMQKLGVDEKSAVVACQVFLELCEVKRYWEPKYEYNSTIHKIIIKAKKKPNEEFSIFVPIPSYEQLNFDKLQTIFGNCIDNIFLAILHPDSTCVYYQISKGLQEPTETDAKHLRVNKQEKLDADLRKHRDLIHQSALFGIPITLPKIVPEDKSKQSADDVGEENNQSSIS